MSMTYCRQRRNEVTNRRRQKNNRGCCCCSPLYTNTTYWYRVHMERSSLLREKKVLEVQGYPPQTSSPNTQHLFYSNTAATYGTDDGGDKHHHHHGEHHLYVVYKRRWLQVLLYSLINMANAMTWITFSPIAGIIGCYYGVSAFWVDSLSLVFMVAYIPCFFLASWSLDTVGLRFGV